jgi:hypothetical protein
MESGTESRLCTGLSTENQWIETALGPLFLHGTALLALAGGREPLKGSYPWDSAQRIPFMIKNLFGSQVKSWREGTKSPLPRQNIVILESFC